jgi:hypothetical protein
MTYNDSTQTEFEYIMTEPIMTSRLMFNASLLYSKKLTSLTELELFEVRKRSLTTRK